MQHSRTTTRPTQPAEPPPRPAIRDAPQAETRRAFALYGDNNLQRLDQLMQLLGPLLTPADLDRADDLLRAIIDHEFGRALVDADTRARAETL